MRSAGFHATSRAHTRAARHAIFRRRSVELAGVDVPHVDLAVLGAGHEVAPRPEKDRSESGAANNAAL